MAPVFRLALQEYVPADTLGAFLDYFPEMRDLLRSTNSAENLLHLLLEDTAFSIDNIYALQYDTYGDDLVVAASVAAQTGNNMATLTTAVSNLGGSYLTIIDTIERMVVGEQEMQLSEHHFYGSSRLGIKNYLPRQVYAYWNNTDVIPVADTGSLLSRRPWYSLEYNDVINGLALSPYGSTDQTTSGSQHLAGQRQYEMTNHLGNVLATLSDLPYKSEGEVLQFRVNPALRAVYDYYPFGSLKPGRYVSDTTENCVTMTQSRWVVKYRDSTVWNTGWVSAPATKPNLGIAQQITLSSLPGNGISIEIEDTAAVGGLMTAVQELSVTPNVRQDIELNLQVVSGTFVLRVLEEVNGTDVLLGSLTVSDAGGSDGTVSAPVSYSISILPSTGNVKLQVSSPITMGTVLCCAPRTMNGYWKKITVPYLEQENIVVTLCDSIGDKYRFGYNGQEKVNELAGIGNHNTAEHWEYDTRLGRRWNLDPKDQINISNYAVNRNNPILYNDPNGNSPLFGAFVGMGLDVVVQLVLISTGAQEKFSWSSVLISGVTGAVGVGIANKIGKISSLAGGKVINKGIATATDIAANTALGVTEDMVKDLAENGEITKSPDITSNVLSAIAGKAAGDAVEAGANRVFNNSAKLEGLNKTLKARQQNANNNPKSNPNASRNQKVREAQEAVDAEIAKKANKVTKSGIVAASGTESGIDVVEETNGENSGTGGSGNGSGGSGNSSGGSTGNGNGASGKGSGGAGAACFIAGTKVKTINGYKNIEDINSGDTLWTRNECEGISEFDIVDLKVTSYTNELYYIRISDFCTFYVTPPHSYFINDGVWTPAKNLKIGDVLWTTSGLSKMKISNIFSMNIIGEKKPVYNIVMKKNHNYYVSYCDILVHNAEVEIDGNPPPNPNTTPRPKLITR